MVLLRTLGNIIGNLLGNNTYFEDDTISPCFQPGILLDSGISWVQLIRRFLLGGIAVEAKEEMSSHKCDMLCRASELPIYINEEKTLKKENKLCPAPPGVLESTISSIRQGIWSICDTITGQSDNLQEYINEGTAKANSMVKYLSEESDDTTRMGAIGVGALTGFLLGLRGGMFKKLVYASAGALAMSGVCYPKETYQYSQEGMKQAKKNATIMYNFIYGVSVNNKETDFEFPQIPTTLDEAKEVFTRIGKSASAFFSEKDSKKPSERVDEKQEVHLDTTSEEVVQNTYDDSITSCHCPVGACLGRHDPAIAE